MGNSALFNAFLFSSFILLEALGASIENKTAEVCFEGPQVNLGGSTFQNLKQCEQTAVGKRCQVCCNSGYDTQVNPECTVAGTWNPSRVACGPSEGCMPSSPSVYYYTEGNPIPREMFLIPVKNCTLLDGSGGELYYGSVYEASRERKLPFFTVYHFTKRNTERTPNPPRSPCWQRFACTQEGLNNIQLTNADYQRISEGGGPAGFDKGHLANRADFQFANHPILSTYRFINAIPQDRFTNQGPWNDREAWLRDLMGEPISDGSMRGGFVLTGSSLTHDVREEIYIPKFVWKLVCTRTDEGKWTVGGFFHWNRRTETEDEKAERWREVEQIHPQSTIIDMLHIENGIQLWEDASRFFEGEAKDEILKCSLALSPETESEAGKMHFWGKLGEMKGEYETDYDEQEECDDEDYDYY